MNKSVQTSIDIYGQTFTILADPEEEKNLRRVADDVNEFLREKSCKSAVPIHRLALMAAFQYAYELDMYKKSKGISGDTIRKIEKKLDQMLAKLEDALDGE